MFDSLPYIHTINLSTIITYTIVLFITVLLIKHVIRRIRYSRYTLPPGPSGYPIIGNVTALDHNSVLDHREKYGDVSYINLIGNNIVILNSVGAIRDAFKGPTADVFSYRPDTFAKSYLIHEDVVLRSPNEKNWKQLRKIYHSLLKQYGEGKVELERVVGQELNVVIGLLEEKSGEIVDINDYLAPSLLNIIAILLIGERYEYDHWRITWSHESFRIGNKLVNPFVDNLLFTFPFLRFLPFGIGKTIQRVSEVVDRYLIYMLNAAREGKNREKTGILPELFRLKDEHDWISDDIICGISQDTESAGFLTTRSSLYSLVLILIHNTDIQTKIQDEITNVIGNERQPMTSDRANMPYTQAVLLELTRYTSSVAFGLPHMSAKTTTFRGFTIPRGSVILANIFSALHDNKLWEDPWKFNPNRFLDESNELVPPSHPNRQNLIPFGVGRRKCMGEVFAKTRIFLYLTFLLQRFTFEARDDLKSCDPRGFTSGVAINPPDYKVRIIKR